MSKRVEVEAVELIEEAMRMRTLYERLQAEGGGWDNDENRSVKTRLASAIEQLEALAGQRLVAHTKGLLRKP